MLGLAPAPIPLALAIGTLALAAIGTAIITYLVTAGHWRRVREADRRAVEHETRRMRAVAKYQAADAALPRAKRGKQATGPMVKAKVRARAAILAQDLKLKRAE